MANEQNLKPFTSDQSREEAAKNGALGGKRSGEVRRERADLRRVIQDWLSSEVGKDKNGNPLTGAGMMAAVAVKEMSKGSARHWELIRDTAGFKPVDKVIIAEVDQEVIDDVERLVSEAEEETEK